MVAELGHFALILGFVVAILVTIVPLVGAYMRWPGWMRFSETGSNALFLLTVTSFGALTYAFVVSDFSVKLVWMNSHTAKPMLYKITGVWGNHEGSMLLWVLILTLFGAMASWFGNGLPPTLKARILAVQASITTAFMAFVLFTSNPFLRLDPAPLNGKDLNPLLQDPGLAFHPPFLYLGYVGLSMAFSFADTGPSPKATASSSFNILSSRESACMRCLWAFSASSSIILAATLGCLLSREDSSQIVFGAIWEVSYAFL